MDIYASRNKYWPAYTWKMQTSYLQAIDEDVLKHYPLSEKEFKSLLGSIFNKINASFYHFPRLKENQEIAIETGKQLAQMQHPEVKGCRFRYNFSSIKPQPDSSVAVFDNPFWNTM